MVGKSKHPQQSISLAWDLDFLEHEEVGMSEALDFGLVVFGDI
jgi:hypothetical protein